MLAHEVHAHKMHAHEMHAHKLGKFFCPYVSLAVRAKEALARASEFATAGGAIEQKLPSGKTGNTLPIQSGNPRNLM